jgi:hypothetical protein
VKRHDSELVVVGEDERDAFEVDGKNGVDGEVKILGEVVSVDQSHFGVEGQRSGNSKPLKAD